jgi:hypothetical protein
MTRPPRRRSARLRWFHRADFTGSGSDPESTGRGRELENSVNQAFRRWPPRPNPDPFTILLRFLPILSTGSSGHRPSVGRRRSGLIPERKSTTRGNDWGRGRVWTFDRETYTKARPLPAHAEEKR